MAADKDCVALSAREIANPKGGLVFQCQYAKADTTYHTDGDFGKKFAGDARLPVNPVGKGWRACGVKYRKPPKSESTDITIRVADDQHYEIISVACSQSAHLFEHVTMRWVRPSQGTPQEVADKFDCGDHYTIADHYGAERAIRITDKLKCQ
jgi:hypothetical protein